MSGASTYLLTAIDLSFKRFNYREPVIKYQRIYNEQSLRV